MDNSLQQTQPPRKQLIIELLVILGWFYVTPLLDVVLFSFGFNAMTFGGGAIYTVLARGAQTSLLLYLIWSGGEPFSRFGFKKPSPGDLGRAIPLILIIYVMDLLIQKIVPTAVFGYGTPPDFVMVTTWSVLSIIFGAVFEETLMRSYLITRLEQIGWKSTYAVLLGGVLFAAIHVYQGWWSPVSAGVFGLLFGVCFVLTRRVWPLIIAHATINIFLAIETQEFFVRLFRR